MSFALKNHNFQKSRIMGWLGNWFFMLILIALLSLIIAFVFSKTSEMILVLWFSGIVIWCLVGLVLLGLRKKYCFYWSVFGSHSLGIIRVDSLGTVTESTNTGAILKKNDQAYSIHYISCAALRRSSLRHDKKDVIELATGITAKKGLVEVVLPVNIVITLIRNFDAQEIYDKVVLATDSADKQFEDGVEITDLTPWLEKAFFDANTKDMAAIEGRILAYRSGDTSYDQLNPVLDLLTFPKQLLSNFGSVGINLGTPKISARKEIKPD